MKVPASAGFTLIELLVVVAVIAILAAIAVPNFLEAQTRAKVSRTKADIRTVTIGVEAYRVDYNDYPLNDGLYNVLPIELSSPIAYLTTTALYDPFKVVDWHPVYGLLERQYTYTAFVYFGEYMYLSAMGRTPPPEAVDGPSHNLGAIARFGDYRIVGWGPDRMYSDPSLFPPVENGAQIVYDATNGTVSFGNIVRFPRNSG